MSADEQFELYFNICTENDPKLLQIPFYFLVLKILYVSGGLEIYTEQVTSFHFCDYVSC